MTNNTIIAIIWLYFISNQWINRMNKTVTVRAMIDPKKKEKVSKILSRLGLNYSEAINIFYSLIEEYKGLPFDIKIPPKEEKNKNINRQMIEHLKKSMKKNHRLGELLAK